MEKFPEISSDPFASNFEPIAFFIPEQWRQLLQLLEHLCLNGQRALVVTGLTGVGKTSFLKAFLQTLPGDFGLCNVQGDQSINADVLRYLLAKHLGLELEDTQRETFHRQFNLQLGKLKQSNKHYVMIVDDAHLLPQRTLAAILDLLTMHQEHVGIFHIALVGGPQLEAAIADITAEHLGEELTHTSRLKPWNFEDTKGYIEHRLQSVGVDLKSVFSTADLEQIYQLSGGVPGKINEVCQQLLPVSTAEKPKKKKEKQNVAFVKPIKYLLIVAMITVAVILLLASTEVFKNQTKHRVVERELEPVFPVAEESEMKFTEVSPVVSSFDVEEEPDQEQTFIEGERVVDNDGDEDDEEFGEAVTSTAKVASTSIEQKATEPQRQVAEEIGDKIQERNETAKSRQAVAEKILSNQSSPEIVVGSGSAKMDAAASKQSHALLSKENELLANIDPEVAGLSPEQFRIQEKFKPSSLRDHQLLDKNKLMNANKEHYTLQLMGAYEKSRLEQFIQEQGLKENALYYQTTHNGKDWFVVVIGNYTSLEAAHRGIDALPPEVRKQKPWARKFSSIQKVIHETS